MTSYYKLRESYEWKFFTYKWKEKLSSALRFSGGEDIWCFIPDPSSLYILKEYSSPRAITGHVESDQWTSKEKCARVGGTVMFRQAASFDCLVVTFCFSSFKMVFSQNFLFRFLRRAIFVVRAVLNFDWVIAAFRKLSWRGVGQYPYFTN